MMPHKDPDVARRYRNDYHRHWRSIPENAENERAYHREWTQKHKESESVRRKMRHFRTRESIRKPLWEKQNGKCAICDASNPDDIDHNKRTKMVRGLLCHRCNLFLAGIESPIFSNAVAYLIRHQTNPSGILYRLQHPKKVIRHE